MDYRNKCRLPVERELMPVPTIFKKKVMIESAFEETKEIMVDWPGWSLAENKYGDEFDGDARIRMVVGGRKLIPYLLKYGKYLGDSLLEIGPFFNPLLRVRVVKEVLTEEASVTFLENDPSAIKWLNANFFCRVLDLDMNSPSFQSDLARQLDAYGVYPNSFNTVILSQVLNYVDHNQLLKVLYPILRPGGLMFINNVINYGIPVLFSKKRPKSNKEIIKSIEGIGYTILEKAVIPRQFQNEPQGRLILVISAT
jgi:hypothetical protein